ncbi:MAG: hypothetical protein JST26_05505 [Bacteroidetes bacterium]|nr:hypothetical protein [Bacteroidota bacterium]
MKKAIIAVFSVSITAGTLYLTYSQVKAFMIKKLVSSWQKETKKQNKELTSDQVKHLSEELDKLYLWEVKWLSAYSAKALVRAPEKEITPLLNKLKEKKILDKVDLKAVDVLLFGT